MFSDEEAYNLIKTPKNIIGNNNEVNLVEKYNRFYLSASEYPEYKFLVEFTVNKKIIIQDSSFKVSLHHQEDNSCTWLMRIDYKGRHTNPEEIIDSLAERFRAYVGKSFSIEEPHIHYYVAGYPPLAWALPLTVVKFPIKEINSNSDTIKAIELFANEINLQEKLIIQSTIGIENGLD